MEERIADDERQAGLSLSTVDELEVTIEKLVAGGDGLVRHEGVAIFVPRAAPGDRLKIRLVERRPSFGRAEIVEILEPGPERREPPCPHYARCGGCQLQHLNDTAQLKYKAQTVRENLQRLGPSGEGVMPEKVVVVPGQPWGYRSRAQFHVGETDAGRQIGYFAHHSNDLVPIDSCPVLVPELEELLPEIEGAMGPETHRRIDVLMGDGGKLSASPAVRKLPRGEVELTVGEFTYLCDAGCFFQGHRQLVETLVEHALGPEEDGESDAEAYDLYSGVGLFSLPLSKRYGKVVAVEGERAAVRFARKNARRNGCKNVTFEAHAVDSWIDFLPERPARVLVDPPRVGLSTKVRETLLERRPRRLTYVSCDSATLARDLKDLVTEYRIESLALLDMFPQTGHMESVVQLVISDESPREASPPMVEGASNTPTNPAPASDGPVHGGDQDPADGD